MHLIAGLLCNRQCYFSFTALFKFPLSFSWHWFFCPCARFCMPGKGFVAVTLLWVWWLGAAWAWKRVPGRRRLAVWSSPVFSWPLREPWWPRTPLPSLMYITQSRMESKIKELIFVTSVWVLCAACDTYMLLFFAELLEFSHISSFSAWMACLRTRQSISSCSKTFIIFLAIQRGTDRFLINVLLRNLSVTFLVWFLIPSYDKLSSFWSSLILPPPCFTDGMTFFFKNAVLVLCQTQWDADLDSLKTDLYWDTWGLQFCRCCFLWSYLTSRMGSRCTLWVILVGKSILSNHSDFLPVRKLCTVYGKDCNQRNQLWIPLQIRWLKRWFLR